MTGLSNLTTVGEFRIHRNAILQSIGEINSLNSVLTNLFLGFNPELIDIDLASLSAVGAYFSIINNVNLPTCAAENLRDQVLNQGGIGGGLAIENNLDDASCEDDTSED